MRKKAKKHSSKLINELMAGRDKNTTAMTRNRMLLAAKIDDGIKAKGWNKGQFAKQMGKEPSVITKWLSGTHNFTADRLTEIGLILGIDLLNVGRKEHVVRHDTIIVSQKNTQATEMGLVESLLVAGWFYKQETTSVKN